MESLTALLLIAAVLLAALKGIGADAGRFDLGWLAVAFLIAGAFLLPALDAAGA